MSASDGYQKIAERQTLEHIVEAASSAIRRETLATAAAFAPPGTGIERRLVDIWKEVLIVDEIGIDDTFFELNGDSLGMVQVLIRIHDVWNADVSIEQFFEGPTVRQLASAVMAAHADVP
jgi:acyl carrier protein